MNELLKQVLISLAVEVPILLALVTGLLILLISRSPGKLRAPAIAGLAVLLGCHLLSSILMPILPGIMLERFHLSYEVYTRFVYPMWLGFNLLEALGYGLLFMALMMTLRQLPASGSAAR